MGIPYNEIMIMNGASPNFCSKEFEKAIDKVEGVIIGGLAEGGYETMNKQIRNTINNLTPGLKKLLDMDKPTLSICFGTQIIGEMLGVDIVTDKKMAETGVVDMELTSEGKKDPIFDGVDTKFKVIAAHKASLKNLPKNTIHLARNDKCSIQAYKHGKSVYAVQFHPEITFEQFEYRVSFYPEYKYKKDKSVNGDEIVADKIVRNFVKLVSNK